MLAHPSRLLALVAVAALAAAYVVLQLRRPAVRRAWSQDALHASSTPRRPGALRHLPALLVLLGLVATTTAFAGPRAQVEVARERGLVVVALDTSASMLAQDVAPDRWTAAKAAAAGFVSELPEGFDVALVGFAGTASVVVPATRDGGEVTRALTRLELSGGTALGDAVLASLAAAAGRPADVPAAVVLLADGGSSTGTPLGQAAASAESAGVPVTTIAYGTAQGVVVQDGRTFSVPVDEAALAALAEATGGQAYAAATGAQLTQVYDSIRGRLSTTVEQRDVSALVAGLGLLLLTGAAVAAGVRSGLR